MLDDDALGMNARISRRDFVNGAAVAVGALGAGVPALGAARAGGLIPQDETYPPSRTGMRGSACVARRPETRRRAGYG
jgi:spermidine dehydrogenase